MILQKRITLFNTFNKLKNFFMKTVDMFLVNKNKLNITLNIRFILYGLFILVHLLLLNINVAEWGDSYRILRASEYVRSDGIYPTDEKRPPLYSLLLSIRPENIDQILWGRLLMFFVSLVYFYLFDKFISLFIKNDKYKAIALLLFTFNPVLLYWSIRIYADTFFALIVLSTLYLFLIWSKNTGLIFKSNNLDYKHSLILGFLTGLAVLTRFEGYLLFGSIGLSLFLLLFLNISSLGDLNYLTKSKSLFSIIGNIFNSVFSYFKKDKYKNFVTLSSYILSFLLTLLPWFLYRNPLDGSSYLSEPEGRSYDLKMLSIYLVSILFIYGFTSAFYFLKRSYKNISNVFSHNLVLLIFTFVYLVLILLWPAAIPRLFVPILPIFILVLILSIQDFFEDYKNSDTNKIHLMDLYYVIPLFLIYIFFQYFLKLQFLVPTKILFAILLIIQVVNIFSISTRNFKLFIYSLFVSICFWSFSVIWIHKDTFISVKNAAEYMSEELTGVVAYNDVSSVSDWYLNQKDRSINKANFEYNDNISGYFYNFENDDLLTQESLISKGMNYLLITNEHNTTMDISLDERPYLTLIKEFSYNVNGKIFNTRVVKLNKDYINE